MKRKPPLEHDREPKKLIPHFKRILVVLLPSSANVNYIFRQVSQTGLPGLSYKRNILEALEYLEEGGLVVDISGYKRYEPGKKQIKQLTALGRKLAELIDSVDQYYTLYSELSNACRINQNLVGLNTLLSPSHDIFRIIILRYASIISYVDPNDEKAAIKNDILNGIAMSSISEHWSFLINGLFGSGQVNQKVGPFFSGALIEETIYDLLAKISKLVLLKNIVIEKEAIDVLSSILSVSKLRLEFINDNIGYLNGFIQNPESGVYGIKKEGLDLNFEQVIAYDKKLLALFENYKIKSTKSRENNQSIHTS